MSPTFGCEVTTLTPSMAISLTFSMRATVLSISDCSAASWAALSG